MNFNLWIDDLRSPPETDEDFWLWAKTSEEAIHLIRSHDFDVISFDHDLGGEDTSREVVRWMIMNGFKAREHRVHSANPVGVEWLEGMIDMYLR